MSGMGQFLFKPMALAVGFAMVSVYVLSLSFVPTRCAAWLRARENGDEQQHRAGAFGRLFERWEALMDAGTRHYMRMLRRVVQFRILAVATAFALLAVVVLALGPFLRREFFPEVDAGAFELAVRAASGTRIEVTEQRVAEVEDVIREKIGKANVQMIISELGVTPDWSAAYTANAGPMDAIVRVQLSEDRGRSAQQYVRLLRNALSDDPRFSGLEFAFDAGGMIRRAMNEGKSAPINIRIETKSLKKGREIARRIQKEVERIDGVVDCRIMQRLDYPEFVIDVDREKAADLGFNQSDVMKNVIAALNSSVQFNKKNFWIDPKTHNQYYVGVQYPEKDIHDIETLLDVPVTSAVQPTPVSLRTLVSRPRRAEVPAEVVHTDLAPTIDLTMGVDRRDLGHVSDEIYKIVARFGKPRSAEGKARGQSLWTPYDPDSQDRNQPHLMEGSKLVLSGEYSRMKVTFVNMGVGLVGASVLIYFLMVALFRSYLIPLVVMSAVPIGVIGVVLMLFVTRTAINVQSLLGVVFMVGIVVSNTVLLTDFTQHIRDHEHLNPTEAVCKAASIRVKPIVMTALAAFFALVPMALALERGSEANAPLGRAVIGGLLAGLLTTLFVVPALYSLVVREAH
ncbi:MAG TPA: efflux RND transporter permease subunit, partial [Planctomycetaceae bacterium]|nr:efflux RND transporter permease subunit [Planctomycetaceae bacterium]